MKALLWAQTNSKITVKIQKITVKIIVNVCINYYKAYNN
jgi:hypothetical protein